MEENTKKSYKSSNFKLSRTIRTTPDRLDNDDKLLNLSQTLDGKNVGKKHSTQLTHAKLQSTKDSTANPMDEILKITDQLKNLRISSAIKCPVSPRNTTTFLEAYGELKNCKCEEQIGPTNVVVKEVTRHSPEYLRRYSNPRNNNSHTVREMEKNAIFIQKKMQPANRVNDDQTVYNEQNAGTLSLNSGGELGRDIYPNPKISPVGPKISSGLKNKKELRNYGIMFAPNISEHENDSLDKYQNSMELPTTSIPYQKYSSLRKSNKEAQPRSFLKIPSANIKFYNIQEDLSPTAEIISRSGCLKQESPANPKTFEPNGKLFSPYRESSPGRRYAARERMISSKIPALYMESKNENEEKAKVPQCLIKCPQEVQPKIENFAMEYEQLRNIQKSHYVRIDQYTHKLHSIEQYVKDCIRKNENKEFCYKILDMLR